jgi:hypothetical protein
VRYGRYHDALAARVGLADQTIKLTLRNRAHNFLEAVSRKPSAYAIDGD